MADSSQLSGDHGTVTDQLFDRIPPHDDDAEKAVLGGMLMSQNAISEVAEVLHAQDFYDPKHQTIYQTIMDVDGDNEGVVDAVIIANRLNELGVLEKVGGSSYLHNLVASVPTAANAIYYAQIVRERALLRRVIATGTKIVQLGYSADGSDAEDIVNLAQAEAYELGSDNARQDYAPIYDVVDSMLQQLDDIQQGKIAPGVMTGFKEIDEITHGLQPGQMIVVAGRPGMGKSTLGVDFARHAALHQGLTTIVFSLEMSSSDLAKRIMAAETDIPLAAFSNPEEISIERWHTLSNATARMQQSNLFIDDAANVSLMEIRAKCRRLKQTHNLQLIVIDYLQLMKSGKAVESRQQEVSEFSRTLKLLAKELEVPVVALSQLNRGSEMRNHRKPQLSDLRESGSIEQDADVVFLVHRPEYYEPDDRPGEADIIMAKHRNGPTKTFTLAFNGAKSRFDDMNQAGGYPQDYQ